MKRKVKKLLRRGKTPPASETKNQRITNETMAAHRDEILGSARKYVYPLTHSKHRLVIISLSVFFVSVVAFFSYCTIALYKFRSTSGFLYHVTQVVPFPVARIGSEFVAYENYLFEVNRETYYYQTQQKLDPKSETGQQQLAEIKKQALDKIINDAYIKRLAEEKGIKVSDQEVDTAIAVVRSQNRLGSSDKEFETVLRDFWNWSTDDFRRSLKQQLLAQKVASTLDTAAHDRARAAYSELKAGKDFAELAKSVSEDPLTKPNGGEFGLVIEKTNRDISPRTVDALFKLKPGEYSAPVDVGYGLEIVKNIEQNGEKIRAARILFNFKDISSHLNDIKDKKKTHSYIRL